MYDTRQLHRGETKMIEDKNNAREILSPKTGIPIRRNLSSNGTPTSWNIVERHILDGEGCYADK